MPVPVPAADQALIRIKAFSVNRGEVNQLLAAEEGWAPGWDVSGVVETPAADGSGPALGARVVGWVPGGAWAECAVVRTDQMAALPDGVGFVSAAALPVAGITARRVLGLLGNLDGADIFVTGGAGGVGSFAVPLAVRAGAGVHVSARADSRASYAGRLGASVVVDSVQDSSKYDFDGILESAGGQHLADALGRVRPGGTVVTFGNSSRAVTSLNIADFYRRTRASLVAFALVVPAESKVFRDDLEALAQDAAAGVFSAVQVTERGWSDLRDVLSELEQRMVLGKTVISVQ